MAVPLALVFRAKAQQGHLRAHLSRLLTLGVANLLLLLFGVISTVRQYRSTVRRKVPVHFNYLGEPDWFWDTSVWFYFCIGVQCCTTLLIVIPPLFAPALPRSLLPKSLRRASAGLAGKGMPALLALSRTARRLLWISIATQLFMMNAFAVVNAVGVLCAEDMVRSV